MSVTTGTLPGVRIVDMPDLGAFTDDSSIVGEHAGSGRFSAPALRNYMGRGIVNVLDHGAVGDGAADDTSAIQAVLNTYAGKAIVYVPATGHPYMVAPLTVPSSTDLLINGTLMLRPGSTQGLLFLNSVNNVTIRGSGIIDGNRAGQTGLSAGINGYNCDNVSVSGITMQNAYAWNFNMVQSTRVRLFNAKMLGGGNSSEFAQGSDDCWITNCTVDGPATDMGFAFYGGVTNSGAIGNIFRNASVGVFVLSDAGQTAPSKNIIISDNIVYGNFSSGIVVDTAVLAIHESIIVANNRVYRNNTGNAADVSEIYINHTVGAMVSNNLISSNDGGVAYASAHGIGIGANATHTNITGNSIYNIGMSGRPGTGIYVASSPILLITGNTFNDFRTPQYMASSIGGTAGPVNAATGNFCFLPITITLQPDTAVANISGGQWTAGTGGTASSMQLNGIAGQNSVIEYSATGAPRWFVGTDGSAETGSNHGSNFEVISVTDTGGPTLTFGIDRATGQLRIVTPPPFATDAAAATGGVPLGGLYRIGSALQIRVI